MCSIFFKFEGEVTKNFSARVVFFTHGWTLGKDAANEFISIRSEIHYGDNGLPGIDPQVVMGPGSPNADDSWGYSFTA